MKLLLVAIGAVVVLTVTAAFLSPREMQGPCAIVHGPGELPEIPEASGLAVSRRHSGMVWAHNDSGHAPLLFAVDTSGTVRGRVRLPVRTRDWEDLTAARCAFGDCLYIGDIGDNDRARRRIQVFRILEPALDETETPQPQVFSLAYADGPHDAEALFVAGDRLFIITKDRVGAIYRSPALSGGGDALTMARIGQLDVAMVSDAEASYDGGGVVVRTPGALLFYRTADVTRGGDVQPTLRVSLEAVREPQGEGVAWGPDGLIYLASEGGAGSRAGRLTVLRCNVPVP